VACGSNDVLYCDADGQPLGIDELHPAAGNPEDGTLNSYLCQSCFAGWIEPNEPQPIKWVRPYWRLSADT